MSLSMWDLGLGYLKTVPENAILTLKLRSRQRRSDTDGFRYFK